MVQRYDAFSDRAPAQSGKGDLSMWLHRDANELHPLEKYSWRSSRPIAMGKSIVKAENMATYEVRAYARTCQQCTDRVHAYETFTPTMVGPMQNSGFAVNQSLCMS